MALLKKNTWLLYALFVVISVLLAVMSTYMRWDNLVESQKQQQAHRAEQVASSIEAILLSHEMLLDLLGQQLLNEYQDLNDVRSPKLLDDLMVINPSVIGFGLARPDGQLVLVNSAQDREQLPNLLHQEASRDSFLYTLQASGMVLGRTYFLKAIGSWGIPIRKALRNEQGNVIAVMTAGIKIEGGARIFEKDLHFSNTDEVSLVRDRDHYFQYQSSVNDDLDEIYQSPINPERLDASLLQLTRNGQALAAVKALKEARTYIVHHPKGYRIEAAVYEPKHELWVFASSCLLDTFKQFIASMMIYVVIFVFVQVMVFSLFRSIVRSEKQTIKQLEYLATHDALTQLPNRQYLINHIQQLVHTNPDGFSLLFLDINNFKGINDSFGHDYGDQVLKQMGNKMQTALVSDEFLVRLGSDEFVVVTPECREDKLTQKCEQLASTLQGANWIQGLKLHVEVSIGVACYPQHGQNLNALLRAADVAMYKAKSDKTGIEFYQHDVDNAYLKNYRIEQALRSAIGTDELYMFYQPQVDHHGQMIGVEALVRWLHPEMGFISPARFIPIAETSDLMTTLGAFVVERTLSEMSQLRQQSGKSFTVSINISVRQLMHSSFIDGLMAQVCQYQFQPQDLILEITENLFIEDMNNVGRIIIELQTKGFNISLDDFGTGYSSLNVLQKLPIDELKVDKSFVDDITRDEKARKMIKNIIAIGKNYGMSVLAEGVETAHQARMLSNFGCDYFQGYLFAKPMSANDLREYLQ